MNRTIEPTLPWVALALAAVPVAAAQSAESEIIDLGPLVIRIDEGPAESIETLDPYRWNGERSGMGSPDSQDLSTGGLADLFEAFLESKRDQDELRFLSTDDTLEVEVRGAPDRIARAKRLASFLHPIITESRRFEVVCLPGQSEGSGGVISKAEAQEQIRLFEQSGREVQRWVLNAGPGSTGMLSDTEQVAFLADYDVEIAGGAWMHDPVVCKPTLGISMAARCSRAGNGYALRLFVERSDALGGVTSRAVKLGGLVGREGGPVAEFASDATLENLDILTRGFAVDAYLGSDEALDLRLGWSLEDSTQSERYLVLPVSAGGNPWHRLDLGDMELVLFESAGLTLGSFSLYSESSPLDPSVEYATPLWLDFQGGESSYLYEELDRFAVRGRGNSLGPWIWIPRKKGDAALDQDFENLLSHLSSRPQAMRTTTFEIGRGLETGSLQAGVFGSLPLRPGAPSAVWATRGTMLVTDNDVEVATVSSVMEPNVYPRLEGAYLSWEVSDGEVGVHCDLKVESALRSGAVRSLTLQSLGGSVIDFLPIGILREERSAYGNGSTLVMELGQSGGAGGMGGRVTIR